MNQQTQAEPARTAATPSQEGNDLWLSRLRERYATQPVLPPRPCPPLSDEAKYCWIRANRGNFAIAEALNSSDRDIDFDLRIEAAMHMSAAGRHYYSDLGDLLR